MSAGENDIRQARFDQARVATLIRTTQPDDPLALMRPDVLRRTALKFQKGFPGQVSYAVKANPAPDILSTLAAAGVQTFDVASVAEMEAVRRALPTARLHYHNPIRSIAEITRAKAIGVASWSVDRLSELDKLDDLPTDMQISVRLSLERGGGAYDFGTKFGAAPEDAVALLKEVAARGMTPALTFHPGTQCTDPTSWADYIAACSDIARRAGVTLASLNVGGGFPSGNDKDGCRLSRIFKAISDAVDMHFPKERPDLWCEPGRAMVADALWLLLRIKARSDNTLYLNEGLYGALGEWRDMPVPGSQMALTQHGEIISGTRSGFTIFGPTCDSLDRVPGKWDLPKKTAEGDYILLTGAGAYSLALVTGFNGYGTRDTINLTLIRDPAGQCRLAG